MSTDVSTDYPITDTKQVRDQPHNPLIGMVGFMSAFAAVGAAFVGITRHEMAIVTQLGIVAMVCGALAGLMASAER